MIGSNDMSHPLLFFLDLKADALARTNIKINMEKFLEVSPMMLLWNCCIFSHGPFHTLQLGKSLKNVSLLGRASLCRPLWGVHNVSPWICNNIESQLHSDKFCYPTCKFKVTNSNTGN